ncbi:MAG: hypothetical protein FWC06_01680 [Treponema sp.]|nr:hypothetical protein [Treponema sp.]
MKFKYLIIAFSVIIVIIICITVLVPIFIAGPEYAVNFRYITFPLLIFMVLILVGMSIFFFLNYRLLSLLEREDWPALAYYLEHKVYGNGRYSSRNVRILASSYLVISDYQSVLKLEGKTHIAKPSAVYDNVLIFGAAMILSGKYGEAATFYKINMDKCRKKDKQWVRWFFGFSQLLTGAFSAAEPEFSSLAVSSNEPLITGISAYFLHNSLGKKSSNPEKCRQIAENGKKRIISLVKNPGGWKKEAEKMGTDVHVAIIRKYVDETGKWLFEPI